jgi:hypothetical protein
MVPMPAGDVPEGVPDGVDAFLAEHFYEAG